LASAVLALVISRCYLPHKFPHRFLRAFFALDLYLYFNLGGKTFRGPELLNMAAIYDPENFAARRRGKRLQWWSNGSTDPNPIGCNLFVVGYGHVKICVICKIMSCCGLQPPPTIHLISFPSFFCGRR